MQRCREAMKFLRCKAVYKDVLAQEQTAPQEQEQVALAAVLTIYDIGNVIHNL